MRKAPDLRPMSEFDPTRASMVHDSLNDKTFAWKPEWAESYREYANNHAPGVIEWDGLLLDGWSTAEDIKPSGGGRQRTKSASRA